MGYIQNMISTYEQTNASYIQHTYELNIIYNIHVKHKHYQCHYIQYNTNTYKYHSKHACFMIQVDINKNTISKLQA